MNSDGFKRLVSESYLQVISASQDAIEDWRKGDRETPIEKSVEAERIKADYLFILPILDSLIDSTHSKMQKLQYLTQKISLLYLVGTLYSCQKQPGIGIALVQEALDLFNANDPATLSQHMDNFEFKAKERLQELAKENSFTETLRNNTTLVMLGAAAAVAAVGLAFYWRSRR